MTHLIPIGKLASRQGTAPPAEAILRPELADRMRAAYIEVGCPRCARPNAVQVSHLKDVTRAVVACDGCGVPYRRDEAVSLTLLGAIGRNLR